MAAGTDLGDRLAERGPVHDEDRQSRPQKRREHAEDGVGAEVRRDEARHDREDDARQRTGRAEDAEEEALRFVLHGFREPADHGGVSHGIACVERASMS